MPTFRTMSRTAFRSGPCEICGKPLRRQRRFWQTVNPFNTNPDGSVKSPQEVDAAVRAEADAWQPRFVHSTCERDAA